MRKHHLAILPLLLLMQAVSAAGLEQASIRGAYRFDGIVTHGWEHELRADYRLDHSLALSASLHYLDATQDSIAGIAELRGKIASGLVGLQWRTLRNHLFIDARAGVDGVLDQAVKPRGAVKIETLIPLPPNRLFQHMKFTPETWYTHAMFNGPAIANRIASYGYAGNLGWSMGPKMAAAVNFRREFLNPKSNTLNPDFTHVGLNGDLEELDVDTDSLPDNVKTSFYGYIYRQLTTSFYAGYAFSWTTTRHDRRVLTDHSLIMPQDVGMPGPGFGIPIASIYSWAYYPYPTPREMLAHSLTIALNMPIKRKFLVKSSVAIPIYSRQSLRYPVSYWEHKWIVGEDEIPIYDRKRYPFQAEEFTGPLTIAMSFSWNLTSSSVLEASYDYFGFPYEKWAYFTIDSYSLHTVALELKQRF